MLTEEERWRIIDYFESWELAEFLKLSIENLVDSFEDDIEDKLTDINELMGVKYEDELP